ncbi:hypothetical protein Tco_0271915 [Tanacetum coccineum]
MHNTNGRRSSSEQEVRLLNGKTHLAYADAFGFTVKCLPKRDTADKDLDFQVAIICVRWRRSWCGVEVVWRRGDDGGMMMMMVEGWWWCWVKVGGIVVWRRCGCCSGVGSDGDDEGIDVDDGGMMMEYDAWMDVEV